MLTCTRKLEFDAGHRVLGHPGKCRFPHGHRYVVEVTACAPLNELGMVIDFGDLKGVCGSWIEKHLDHGFMVYEKDKLLREALRSAGEVKLRVLPFNPTAENLAHWFLSTFSEMLDNLIVQSVKVWETPNCWAEATNVSSE